jgi:hypothetical protein
VGPVVPRAAGGYWVAQGALLLAGLSAAMFVVPVQAALQDAPPPGMKGKTFAVNNFCNWVGILFAGVFYLLGTRLHVAPAVTATLAGGLLLLSMWLGRGALRELRVD